MIAKLEAPSSARFAALAARVDTLLPNVFGMVEVVRDGFAGSVHQIEIKLNDCLDNHCRTMDARMIGLESACFALTAAACANNDLSLAADAVPLHG